MIFRGARTFGATIVVTAASIALAVSIIGSGRIVNSLSNPHYPWVGGLIGSQVIAYAGYALAYKSLFNQKFKLATRNTLYGFSPLVALGGFAYDAKNIKNRHRVVALAAVEYAVLTPLAWLAAIIAVGEHINIPKALTLPWIITFPIGVMGVAAIIKWRIRLGPKAAIFLDAFLRDCWSLGVKTWLVIIIGIAIYWTGELAALFAALKLFDTTIALPALVLAFASGYILTQRSSPAIFSGLIIILLILMLHLVGVPYGASFLVTYSFLTVSILLPLVYLAVIGRRVLPAK